jgi:hypothetical protein
MMRRIEPSLLLAVLMLSPTALCAQAPPPAAVPGPPPPTRPIPGPYFEPDPLLDAPPTTPGWFTEVELGVLVPHSKIAPVGAVRFPGADPVAVSLPNADLDWTVSPRFEFGYRLPSAFGELSLGYRFLATQGTSGIPSDVGSASLRSRLDFNLIDFDYASREIISLGPDWDMKWRFGGRLTYLYYDSLLGKSPDLAAGTDGTLSVQTSNSFVGFGPHSALELARRFGDSGLSLGGKIDFGLILGRIRQGFHETALGSPIEAADYQSSSQTVPMLNVEFGLGWQPPQWPQARLFVGYQYEYWANIGRFSSGDSRGELTNQGFVLRGGFDF